MLWSKLCLLPPALIAIAMFITRHLNNKWHISQAFCDKWHGSHHKCNIPMDGSVACTTGKGKNCIAFAWTNWRFLHAYTGLLVNATMVAVFAWTKRQWGSNANGKRLWQKRLIVSDYSKIQYHMLNPSYFCIQKLGVLLSSMWFAMPIVLWA